MFHRNHGSYAYHTLRCLSHLQAQTLGSSPGLTPTSERSITARKAGERGQEWMHQSAAQLGDLGKEEDECHDRHGVSW
jgi:hypothetical protein